MKRIHFFLLLCLLAAPAAQGRDREADLRAEVTFLCDSLCAGRGIGTGGNQAASFYLVRQLRNAGLRTTVQTFTAGGHKGRNVVAVTPGWFRRYIVVGAWFDGLGTLEGRIYPGADANASGVAALLDLARELPEHCTGDVGIVFVAFDGHHDDLAGSQAFLRDFRETYPPVMMVNLDLLGSSLVPVHKDRPDYLIALGGGPRRAALEKANSGPRLDLSYDYYGSTNFTDMFYRRISDQRWFLSSGIPSVMFTSGITEHTNKVSDTPQTLNYPLLRRRIDLIAAWIQAQL